MLRTTSPRFVARNLTTCWLMLMAGTALASTSPLDHGQSVQALQDTGITMTGRCPNGDAYRLVFYEKQVEGHWKSFYDYQGPVGMGTVKTKTVPKVMVSRICIALAEIASDE